jgi:hypothetical protein
MIISKHCAESLTANDYLEMLSNCRIQTTSILSYKLRYTDIVTVITCNVCCIRGISRIRLQPFSEDTLGGGNLRGPNIPVP